MATTVTPQILQARYRIFAGVEPDVLQASIDRAVNRINEAAFGSRFDEAVALLPCHLHLEDELLNATESFLEAPDAIPAGPLMSEKILNWSASVAVSENGAWDDRLATTSFGRKFLALRKGVFARRCI